MTPLQMYLLRSGGGGPDDMRTRTDPTNARLAYDEGLGMNFGSLVKALVPGAGVVSTVGKLAAGVNPLSGSWGIVDGPRTPALPNQRFSWMSQADSDQAHADWAALNNMERALNAIPPGQPERLSRRGTDHAFGPSLSPSTNQYQGPISISEQGRRDRAAVNAAAASRQAAGLRAGHPGGQRGRGGSGAFGGQRGGGRF
jgi:hypothetical protein